jgi:hypothetical protein
MGWVPSMGGGAILWRTQEQRGVETHAKSANMTEGAWVGSRGATEGGCLLGQVLRIRSSDPRAWRVEGMLSTERARVVGRVVERTRGARRAWLLVK